MNGNSSSISKRELRIWHGLTICLIILLLAPIWLVQYPPLGDYPNHLLSVSVLKHFADPELDYARYFSVQWFPLPNMLGYGVMWLLAGLFSVVTAGKVYLTLLVVLFPLSGYYLARSTGRGSVIVWLYAILFTYNWHFNMGFVNFFFSVPLYCLVLGLYWRWKSSSSATRWLVIAFLAVLVYFSHVFTYAVMIWSIGVLALFSEQRVRTMRNSMMSLSPSLLLFVVYCTRLLSTGSQGQLVFIESPVAMIRGFLTYNLFSFDTREVVILAVPLIVYVLLVFRQILPIGKILLRRRSEVRMRAHPELAHFVLAGTLFLWYLVLPISIGAWWAVNVRLGIFVLIAGLGCLHVPESRRVRVTLCAILFAACVAHSTSMVRSYREINDQYSDFASGIEAVRKDAAILPIIGDIWGESEHTEPYLNFWAYYHICRGGIGPYFYAYPYLGRHATLLEYRSELPNPGLFKSNSAWIEEEMTEADYDYIVVWKGDDDLLEDLTGRLRTVWSQGNLVIFAPDRPLR